MFKQKVDKTDRDVVLFVDCRYVLTPKFDALQGAVVLEMFPSSKFSAIKDGSSDVLIYMTLVVSKQPLPGGADNQSSLWMLGQKVNRSFGKQIQFQLKDVPSGTPIMKVNVKGLPE